MTEGKYDVQVILVRTYSEVVADSPEDAMRKAREWADAWAEREERKDGKVLKAIGEQTFYTKVFEPPPPP